MSWLYSICNPCITQSNYILYISANFILGHPTTIGLDNGFMDFELYNPVQLYNKK